MGPALQLHLLPELLLLAVLLSGAATIRVESFLDSDSDGVLEEAEKPVWAQHIEDVHAAFKGTGFRPGVESGPEAVTRHQALFQLTQQSGKIQMEKLQQEVGSRKLEKPEYATRLVAEPWRSRQQPLAKCPPTSRSHKVPQASGPEANLAQAVKIYCAAGLAHFVEFFIDPAFKGNFDRLKGADGWLDQAYVTYMAIHKAKDKISAEEDLLVQSIHHFSTRPMVVVNFGSRLPKSWDPERFPNLVVMHSRNTVNLGKSFNFNKLNSMLFTKVKTGMVLDADQFANQGLDYMLQRAAEETTETYRFPILPTHWMSRDPEDSDMKGLPFGYAWRFKSPKEAPRQTMRWGHAHPTWTHHALPWLANWTSFVLAPKTTHAPQWLLQQGRIEDEDLLNVALWADGASKQWCKYDLPSPGDFSKYMSQTKEKFLFQDKKYYPKGIPYIFFTAHDAKKPEESYDWLTKLWNRGDDKRKAILYDGKWFSSGQALRAYDSKLQCLA